MSATTPTPCPLTIDSVPHVVDLIFAYCDRPTRVRFSQTNTSFRNKVYRSGECACWLIGNEPDISITASTSLALGRCRDVLKHFEAARRIDVHAFPPCKHPVEVNVLRLFITPTVFPCADLGLGASPLKTVFVARGAGVRWEIYDHSPAWSFVKKLVIAVDGQADYISHTSFRRYMGATLTRSRGRLVIIYRPAEVQTQPRSGLSRFIRFARPLAYGAPYPPALTFVNSPHTDIPPAICPCDFCGILLDSIQSFVKADGRDKFLEKNSAFLSIEDYKSGLRRGEWEDEIGE